MFPDISIKYKESSFKLSPLIQNGHLEMVLFLKEGHIYSNKLLSNWNGRLKRKLPFLGTNAYLIKIPTDFTANFFVRLKTFRKVEFRPVYGYEDTKYVYGKELVCILESPAYLEDIKKKLEPIAIKKVKHANIYLLEFNNYEDAVDSYDKLKEMESLNGIIHYDLNAYSFESNTSFNYILKSAPSNCKYQLPYQAAYEQIELHENGKRKYFGDPNIRVGIFDVGIDNDHPDLIKSKDDTLGYDYVEKVTIAIPDKNQSHGTNCAGLIGGNSDGKSGIEGVAKNCTIVDYRIGYQDREQFFRIDLFELIKAFYKASFEDDISIINCSWGMSIPLRTLEYAIDDIFKNGRNGKGTLTIASAGNSGRDKAMSPAMFQNVIGVTGVDQDNIPVINGKWQSNFGRGCDFSAPSKELITTANSSDDCSSIYNYSLTFSGTSAAAPIVSGAAALLLSRNANLSSLDLKKLMTNKKNLHPYSSSKYDEFGAGILNINKLLNKYKSLKTKTMADLSYCSNIVINDDAQNLWQNIYSSQSYGTFYSVFSKFDIDKNTGSECNFDLVQLQIINYKGTLNMAFYRDDKKKNPYHKGYNIKKVKFKDGDSPTKHDYFILLELYVCAKAGNPDSRYSINIEKEDLKGIDACDGQLFFINRKTLSFDGKTEDYTTGMTNNQIDDFYNTSMKNRGVFDNEFFYRNGFVRKKRKDTDASLKEDTYDPINGLLSVEMLDGNPSCHNSAMYFRFK